MRKATLTLRVNSYCLMGLSSSCRTYHTASQLKWDYANHTYHLLQISKHYFLLPCFFVCFLSSVFFSIFLSLIFTLNRLLVITQNQFHFSSQISCHVCLSIDPYFSCLMVLTSVTLPALSSYHFYDVWTVLLWSILTLC